MSAFSHLSNKKPVVVTVTGAAGQIGYSIVSFIAQGQLLGPDQPLELRLLDLPQCEQVLKGVTMELEDLASPLLTKIVPTSDLKTAFEGVEIALLVGARPRGPGMERKDLLKANAAIFVEQGKALDQYAARNVRVLVVGNPANTNALIALKNAPSLKPSQFHAMTRLDQNRAHSAIARRINEKRQSHLTAGNVKNVIIFGNHSNTQYPYVESAVVVDAEGKSHSVKNSLNTPEDEKWLQTDFISTIQKRGAAIIDAMKKSSAFSAANAACNHVYDWFHGTKNVVSMAIYTDKSVYGSPEDVVFSFPCTVDEKGQVHIVEGIQLNDFDKQMIKKTGDELVQERTDALGQ